MKQLILASSSSYRRELLSRLGVEFTALSPELDESPYKEQYSDVHELTRILAKEKAKIIFEQNPEAIVIGSDQALELEGRIFSKPYTHEKACEQIESLAGKTHQLVTAVCLYSKDKIIEFENTTKLTMRELERSEINRYVEEEKPLQCAGSYMIEGKGIRLFEKIETTDFTSIVGLPLLELANKLRQLGLA